MDPGDLLRTHEAPDDLMERALERRSAPRRVSPAWAVAAAFLVGIGTGWFGASREAAEAPPVAAAETVPVRLVFHDADAQSVAVAASWNEWNPGSQPLISDGQGTFSVVVEVPRGRHEYLFVVDGQRWELDPTASLVVEDGFGQRNAVLEI